MPRCPERPCAPCASRGLGLQGPPPPTTHRGPPAPGRAPEISEGRPRPRAGSPRPRRQAPPPAGPHSGRRAGAGGPARSARSSGRGSLGRCPGGAGPTRAAAMVRRTGAGQGRGAQGPLLPAAPRGPAALQPWLCGAGGAVSGCGHRRTLLVDGATSPLPSFALRSEQRRSGPRTPGCCRCSWTEGWVGAGRRWRGGGAPAETRRLGWGGRVCDRRS